ncbi:hypothetical protein S7335_4582 [Synechococcus sp. PCC 7335]|uniref:DUF4112 domain-containing protein n=1 Tax=Synechococcus sp. (strain ATCC 29403 / PCC 7335) TaxID=91464 RepID=UPI00017ED580|nr:DUF4112 domain-containing protein [Synechococcus sp. PCC 7335]EDX86875.1 hypothetical protein S7335_4582 [Synechococcus sp. PCC 7335]
MSLPSDKSSIHKADVTTASLKRLQRMSHLLDKAIAIPGSGIRVGLDPILGLLPGGGDVVTGLLSVYIVFEAAKMGLPAQTLGRMGCNILLDVLSGMVPVLGDLFDVGWKANSQNVALIEKHMAAPVPSRAADKIFSIVVIVGLVSLVIGMAAVSIWVAGQVWTLLFR